MEQNRNHDMQLVHTLAQYIHEAGGYDWSVRSHLAVEELEPGREMHTPLQPQFVHSETATRLFADPPTRRFGGCPQCTAIYGSQG